VQLVIGPKGVKAGEVECKTRKDGAKQTLTPDAALKWAEQLIKSQRVLV
jgi:prolyl-tRNA synthetase